MLGLAGVMRMSALTREIHMSVKDARPRPARNCHAVVIGVTPTPEELDVEHRSLHDGVNPTSTSGWRITPSHALRC